MKNFTLITLIIILSALGNSLFAQQCTPDPNGPQVAGIYPNDSIPDGYLNAPYDEVIQLVLPRDTTVDLGLGSPISASFCKIRLDTILHLPAGVTYECDNDSCIWDIDHTLGVINRGCVRISGTPTTMILDDTFRAVITIVPGNYDTTTMVCDADGFRNSIPALWWPLIEMFLTQESAVQMRVIDNTGLEARQLRESLNLTVYPNPLDGNGYVKFDLEERTNVVVDIVDPMGRIVQRVAEGNAISGENRYEVTPNGLASGMYFIRLQLDGGKHVITEKMTVR